MVIWKGRKGPDPWNWHRWFAWYPVQLNELAPEGVMSVYTRWAWLETVLRRKSGWTQFQIKWDYREAPRFDTTEHV